jgi:protein disulfide-isomerase A6
VTILTAPKLGDFLSKKNETAKAILFTNKGTTGALWKSLAIDFKGAIPFAQVRDKEKDAVEQFGITKFPTIVLLPGGDAAGKVYEGKMEKQALFEFFSVAKPPKSTEEPASENSKASQDSEASSTAKPSEKRE